MTTLLRFSRAVDAANRWLGTWIAWMILVAVLVSAGNATVRKVFNTSSNAWLEIQWLLFSAVFLLCASWTLRDNEHIRIDIVSNMASKRTRDWIEVIGHALFLIPVTLVMVATGWPFFLRSFLQNEQSSNAGGLLVWPAKFLVPLGFALLLAQGVSELIKRVAIMRGLMEDPHTAAGHAAAAAEAERLVAALAEEAAARLAAKPPAARPD
jgi:TRAP-type mannitol/chloroaromatic compound transport system permease small subunit